MMFLPVKPERFASSCSSSVPVVHRFDCRAAPIELGFVLALRTTNERHELSVLLGNETFLDATAQLPDLCQIRAVRECGIETHLSMNALSGEKNPSTFNNTTAVSTVSHAAAQA